MNDLKIKIPEEIPFSSLKRKVDELIKDEELKWALFRKYKEELSLEKKELNGLEKEREKAWKKTKKKYGL
ncbi:MAG: hypothetical protein U9N35_02805 [Euryarchaeota archaeon]|nr:hypothetical protein [Euryarchaeota archaeon]